jgi:hypothetical protein
MADPIHIELIIDDKGTVKIKQFGKQVEKSSKRGTQAMKRMEKQGDKLGQTFKKLAALGGGIFALGRIKSAMTEWVKLAGVQEQAVAGMTQAMISMGRFSPQLHKKLLDVASGLQEITTFGDEATIEGQKFLLTYKNISDEMLPRASKAMLDLAALMKGDTRQAANLLGKASIGLASELKRTGITIDENIAKSGDFSLILGEIEKQVGGQAEALAATGFGGLQQLGNLYSDLKEDMGFILTNILNPMIPLLKALVLLLKDAAEGFNMVFGRNLKAQMTRRRNEIIEELRAVEAFQAGGGGIEGFFARRGGGLGERKARLEKELQDLSRRFSEERVKQERAMARAGGLIPRPEVVMPEVSALEKEKEREPSAVEQFAARINARRKLLEWEVGEENKSREKAIQNLKDWGEQEEAIAKETAENMSGHFENAFFNVMTRRYENLGELGKSILDSLAQSAAATLAKKGGEALGGLIETGMAKFASQAHDGGTIGKTPMPIRAVDPGVFKGAQRLHSGLRADEYPAILQRGETVTPKGKNTGGVNMTFNIQTPDVRSFKASQSQLMTRAAMAMKRAQRNL